MKITDGAPSILALACFFLLAGCESIHVPNFFGADEVPDDVKAKPRLVEQSPTPTGDGQWPRLGDVPFKPKDFSSEDAYTLSMDELEKGRAEADRVRVQTFGSITTSPDAAAQNTQLPETRAGASETRDPSMVIVPPQLPTP